MAVRFISEKDNGIYAYVEYADGKKIIVKTNTAVHNKATKLPATL